MAYTCDVYGDVRDVSRFMLVCQIALKKRDILVGIRGDWKMLVRGFEPPETAREWLKLNGFHITHMIEGGDAVRIVG